MHNCKERVDANLVEHHVRLAGHRPDSFYIETVPIAKRKGRTPISIEATYCPFCGKKVKDVKNN